MKIIQPYKDSFSLISAILFLILGIILIPNPDSIIKFVAYILGAIFILLGLTKIFSYVKHKNENPNNYTNLGFGISFIILGVITMFCSGVIALIIRVIMGGWLLYSGIIKLILAFKLKDFKVDKWYIPLIGSIIMIICGLYTVIVENIIIKGGGFVLVIYSIIEIIQYIIIPKDKNPDIIK